MIRGDSLEDYFNYHGKKLYIVDSVLENFLRWLKNMELVMWALWPELIKLSSIVLIYLIEKKPTLVFSFIINWMQMS